MTLHIFLHLLKMHSTIPVKNSVKFPGHETE